MRLLKRINHKFFLVLFRNIFPYSVFDQVRIEKRNIDLNRLVISETPCNFLGHAKIYNSKSTNSISIGHNATIYGEILLFPYGDKIRIGDNFFMGEQSRIWAGENIIIGNDVLISHNCNIIGSNSHEKDAAERSEEYLKLLKYGHKKEKGSVEVGNIIIEDNVWISFNCTILKNVTIGKGAIIAANSLVLSDVAPHTIVGGYPAKLLTRI